MKWISRLDAWGIQRIATKRRILKYIGRHDRA